MTKRIIDFVFSLAGLLVASPVILPSLVLVYLQDFHSPFYIAKRVGKGGTYFKMLKIRSMVVNAEGTGVVSTSTNDSRITPIGKFIRRFKIDELSQFWNVFKGDMSLVGPRPNVIAEVDLYSEQERKLISVKPGITDLSSIVFSDLNSILADSVDANLDYNQLVRPWKSRLGILYVENQSLSLDLKILFATVLDSFSRKHSLKMVRKMVAKLTDSVALLEIVSRESELYPYPPPGFDQVITNR